MIAALFVATNGPYFGLSGIDPWDQNQDARLYTGPYPVIAHPPCERWGRYWSGGPSAKVKRKLGDDNGCFASALNSVRQFGGVLEHPEASHAFKFYSLPIPEWNGGWTELDLWGGRSCCVAQGHYGHRARKLTWLYAVSNHLPELTWGPSQGERLEEGFHSTQERRKQRAAGVKPIKRLSEKDRIYTPLAFRDLLIEIAQACGGKKKGEK